MNGWLFIDKPKGISSFAIVSLVRRFLQVKKIGHAGTLDPLASGVLALAIGEATKTVPFVMDREKTYEFTIRWGQQTSTDDAEGEVIHSSKSRPTLPEIDQSLLSFTGELQQIPPAYSAVKINGERAYAAARTGKRVDIKSRPISIFELKYLARIDRDKDHFLVRCSKGTYVRSLARDLGIKLGCYGHALNIRRIKSGIFSIENTISLENLYELGHKNKLQEKIIPIPDVLDDIPAVRLGSIQEQQLRYGQSIGGVLLDEQKAQDIVLCLAEKDQPIGLCRYQDQTLKPFRLFNI